MALRCGLYLLPILLLLACTRPTTAERIVLDDQNNSLVYSNSGPSWFAAYWYNGGGQLVSGYSVNGSLPAYLSTWHETLGDGASVSLTFTGTHITLVGTICNSGYNTTIDFFIDGQALPRFQHLVPGPQHAHTQTSPYNSDTKLQYTLGDFTNLSPAEHTFKAVSVGADSLFVVDYLAYDRSEAVIVPSTSTALTLVQSAGTSLAADGSTTKSILTSVSVSGLASSVSSTSTVATMTGSLSQSSQSTAIDTSRPVVADMDVPASDTRIIYSPPDAWSLYGSARRATSCLDGTMSSSTANSSFAYNFTGTAIQLYTVTSLLGGNYSLSLDGQDQGIYTSYDSSRDPSMCSSRPLYSVTGLANSPHTLVLTVREHPLDSLQGTIQFVGFRTSSSEIQSSEGASMARPNIGPIIGGVLGGLCGLVLLILLVLLWIRRQRQKGGDTLPSSLDPPSLPSIEGETWIPSNNGKRPLPQRRTTGSSLSTVSQLSPTIPLYMQTIYHDMESPEPSNRDQGSIQLPGTAGPFDAATGKLPLSTVQRNQTTVYTSQGTEDAATDNLTYYTLPSYHENVMQRAAARNLSQADIDAIFGRLQEVIRNQMEQNGANTRVFGSVMPPQELIDHLVEERRLRSTSGAQEGTSGP